jgi:ketosteroid isomerase-like protein
MNENNQTEINILMSNAKKIYEAWNIAWSNNDIDALLALYADDAIIESPLIPYLLGKEQGVCEGKEEFRKLLGIAANRKPTNRKYYRKNYFTDGKTLMWEYPRVSPDGEQMDFMEVMELKDGLITNHRVYWGWLGFDIMKKDKYFR